VAALVIGSIDQIINWINRNNQKDAVVGSRESAKRVKRCKGIESDNQTRQRQREAQSTVFGIVVDANAIDWHKAEERSRGLQHEG